MIREAVTKDLDVIATLEKSIFDNPYSNEQISKDISCGNVRVIEHDGFVVGYITYTHVADEAEIERIAVNSLYRKMGLGTILVMHALQELKEYGVCKVFLEVKKQNTPARQLYLKCGFKPISERKKYYHDGSDAIIFVNNLEVQ